MLPAYFVKEYKEQHPMFTIVKVRSLEVHTFENVVANTVKSGDFCEKLFDGAKRKNQVQKDNLEFFLPTCVF